MACYEKGSIENRSKLLRCFSKKATNFNSISDDEISRIENMINNRPMKVLNWLSPNQVFEETPFRLQLQRAQLIHNTKSV